MNKKLTLPFFLLLMIFGFSVFFVLPVFASTTNGTIDATSKYVWGSKIGWINFGATNGNVAITDSAITGYAWSEQYGWINLAPTNSGVINDNEGNLSGYAWGEKTGWIDFDGVTINSAGIFTGTATGTVVGTINFDCANCGVETDWRPASSRTSGNTSGGGVALPSSAYLAPASYSVLINDGTSQTNSTTVTLKFNGDKNTTHVWFSEKADLTPAERINYNDPYTLHQFNFSAGQGTKKVYAKFCNDWGLCSSIVSSSVYYYLVSSVTTGESTSQQSNQISTSTEQKITTEPTTGTKTITKAVADAFKKLITKLDLITPDFLKPWKEPTESQPPEDIRKYVAVATPLAMSSQWQLISQETVRLYVFAPLPQDFKALAMKFPQVNELFKNTGVTRFNDIQKITNKKISVPNLSQIIGASQAEFKAGDLQTYKVTPVSLLASDYKKKIPTETVFVSGANQLVDFNTVLTLGLKGEAAQKLATISGKKMYLSVKPEYKVNSVKGYIIFKSKEYAVAKQKNWFASLFFIDQALAYTEETTLGDRKIEKKLVLQEFEYTDTDNDGIYTAEVYSPIPRGEYEIMTVIEYNDPEKGTKVLEMIAVVDPEGYVYEKTNNKETRVPSALVSLYWLNTESKKYELWPASKYQQQNGQITDTRGTYSFLVPPGSYYLQVEATGYKTYISEQFKVNEGEGVHMNIELKSKSWWFKIIDWKTWVIILLIVNLLYMFEREHKRKKQLKVQ